MGAYYTRTRGFSSTHTIHLDDKQDSKNQLELESTMNYLTNKLKVNLENAEMFIVQELLQAPSIGEITRKGYVDGWKMIG